MALIFHFLFGLGRHVHMRVCAHAFKVQKFGSFEGIVAESRGATGCSCFGRKPGRTPKWELNPEPCDSDATVLRGHRRDKSSVLCGWHLCVRSSPLYLPASAERLCSLSPPSAEVPSLTQPPHLISLPSTSLFFPPPFLPAHIPLG